MLHNTIIVLYTQFELFAIRSYPFNLELASAKIKFHAFNLKLFITYKESFFSSLFEFLIIFFLRKLLNMLE